MDKWCRMILWITLWCKCVHSYIYQVHFGKSAVCRVKRSVCSYNYYGCFECIGADTSLDKYELMKGKIFLSTLKG